MTVAATAGSVVPRFEEIEGLRAWLAGAVVGWHLIQYTGLNLRYSALGSSAGVAHLAVELFIIVSGFVVTHLLTTRRESYPAYLIRRAFRLFPIYLVLAAIGIVATGLGAEAVTQVPWADDPDFAYRATLLATHASQQAAFWVHLALHATLLQGIVPDSVLPYASVTMIGPAWSLSLEWQFYLIAPVVIAFLANPRGAPIMVAAMLAAVLIERLGLLGEYRLMSVFPAAAHLFLTGIASRLALRRLGELDYSPLAVVLAGLALAAAAPSLAAIGLWIGFCAFLAFRRAPGAAGMLDAGAARLWAAMFGSAAARWVGARSYGLYLAHWPILQISLFALRDTISDDTRIAAVTLAAIVVPVSVLAADMLHRLVERPMIRVGARIAARWGDSPPRPVAARASAGEAR